MGGLLIQAGSTPSNEDYKTKALKRALVTEVSQAFLAQKLQCRPIEGHDMPLGELQRQLQRQAHGETQAQIIEVQNIESIPCEIPEADDILSMLMPNSLRKATMHFIEVEDLTRLPVALQPQRTQEEQAESQKQDELIKILDVQEAQGIPVSDEMREKTIKCLMKVLDYELKSAQEQAKDIRQHYHKTDVKLKEYEELLKREENRITTEEIKAKIEMAKKKQRQYDEIFDPQRFDEVAETIVENQMIIERVDALIGKRERVREETILTKSIDLVSKDQIRVH